MRKTVCVIALATVAISLGACGGGATVDNQNGPQETVPPLAKSSKSVSAEATPTSTSTGTPSPKAGGGAAAPAPKDEAAQEVSAVPTAAPRPDNEKRYLEELDKQGVKVAGVEDQMVSIADGICTGKGEEQYTLGAVSGQLVEQKRTEKKPEEVSQLLVKTAKDAYC
ncbi:hypothetical protein WG915_04080 [Corynebacterium sp. H128]|uniref:hypothetical protein n=1 Tax=unclassified Corynebacterium TaxID=2624378 RepID=UPI0030A082F7